MKDLDPPSQNPSGKKKAPPDALLLGWDCPTSSPSPVGFNQAERAPSPKPVKRAWSCPDSEAHLLTFAPTGAGKGRSAVIPTCLEWQGGLIAIDPKGEAVATTARRRREMGQEVVVIDPFGITGHASDALNPFDIFPHCDMSVEEFSLAMPSFLHPDTENTLKSDPFWDIKSDSLISGICGYVLAAKPEQERNLAKVRELIMSDDVVYNLAVVLDTVGKQISKMIYQNLSAFLQTEDKCRSGILATAQQHFEIYGDPKTASCLEMTTFDLAAFKEGAPMTIYLVLPPGRLKSHRALLRIWVSSLLAIAKCRTSRPANRTLFLIDEVAQLGRMNALVEAITLLRGYGVRTWTFWQSRRQLEQHYGGDAGVILDNSGVVQCFGLSNLEMAGSLVGLVGNGYSAQDLLRLPRDQQIVLTPGGKTRVLRKLDYLNDRRFRGCYDDNPAYQSRDEEEGPGMPF